jgi:YD repeat-containing protein
MKTILINLKTFLAMIILFNSACKKNDLSKDNKTLNVTSFKIVENYQNSAGLENSYSISYDNQNRLAQIKNLQSTRNFLYQADKIVVSDEPINITYMLDGSGKIKEAKAVKLDDNYEETLSVEYDNQGYLKEINSSANNITTTFTYLNGELTKVEEVELGSSSSSNIVRTSEITYKNEVSNNVFVYSQILPEFTDGILRHYLSYLLMPTLGKPTKRLIDRINYNVSIGGFNNSSVRNFTYLKNQNDNIVKVLSNSDNSYSKILEFGYK